MWTRYFSSSSDNRVLAGDTKLPQIGAVGMLTPTGDFTPRFGKMDKKDQTPAIPPAPAAANRVALARSFLRKTSRIEVEMRQKGLSTELDDSNKGFAMLQKMGYKKGAKE